MSDDDFDMLFDEYQKKKNGKKLKNVGIVNIERLPLYQEVRKDTTEYQCLVCRGDIDDEDIVEACTECERYYHYKHIREWLKIKATCPSCKSKL